MRLPRCFYLVLLTALLARLFFLTDALASDPEPHNWEFKSSYQLSGTFLRLCDDKYVIVAPSGGTRTFSIPIENLNATSAKLARKLAKSQAPVDPQKAEEEIEKSIATLKGVIPSKMTEQEQMEKIKQLDAATRTLIVNGSLGYKKLLAEIKKMKAAGVKDDRFYLLAACSLWDARIIDASPDIPNAWNGTDLNANFHYVFPMAKTAAISKDPRVEPMLLALLQDDKSETFFPSHAMRVGWPLYQQFIYGCYGQDILPAMLKELQTTDNPVVKKSALLILSESFYLPALPEARKLVQAKEEEVAIAAINALQKYAHPDDLPVLLGLLDNKNPEKVVAALEALYEYDGKSFAKKAMPLLRSKNPKVVLNTVAAFLNGNRSAEAVVALNKDLPNLNLEKRILDIIGQRIDSFCEALEIDRKKELVEANIAEVQKKTDDFEVALAEKRKAHLKTRLREEKEKYAPEKIESICEQAAGIASIKRAGYSFALLAEAATSEQFPLLLKVRNSFYRRFSDEALDDVRSVDSILKEKARERYAK